MAARVLPCVALAIATSPLVLAYQEKKAQPGFQKNKRKKRTEIIHRKMNDLRYPTRPQAARVVTCYTLCY